jgi:hypothetical protein
MFELDEEDLAADKKWLAREAKKERWVAFKSAPKIKIPQGDDPKLKFNEVFNLQFPTIESFAEAKQIYKSIAPLKGQRAKFDIRPLGPRRHTRFQIRQVTAQEYTVTLTYLNASRTARVYHPSDVPSLLERDFRLLSFHRDGTIVIHCPVGVRAFASKWAGGMLQSGAFRYQPTHQAWNLLSQVLPRGMYISTKGFRKYGRQVKTYLTIEHASGTKHYLLPAANYALKLKQDEAGEWQVLNPVQELKQSLPKKMVSRIRRVLRDFTKYATVYWDLVPMPPEQWLPAFPLFSRGKFLLDKMEKTPWDALLQLRHTKGVAGPRFATLEAALESVVPVMKEAIYNKLLKRSHDYKSVPIGEMCGLWRYDSFWAHVPPVFAPPKPRRSYKRESTSDNTKSSSASACTPSIDLSA